MNHIILINCKDRAGIIRAVTSFIFESGGNVVYLDQHVDKDAGIFFMRIEFESSDNFETMRFKANFESKIGLPYQMDWSMYSPETIPNMAIFVSKYNHCLYDILSRYKSGELKVNIPFILSNHNDLRYISEQFEIPFYHIPVTKENKAQAEYEQLELLNRHKVDFIVLARYMQIVTENIISKFTNKIINIHHSFLPAFAGAKPYHAAFKRGVKIIGATSHYVTEELDAGPIIEQDVVPVSHSHSIKDFISKGRDLEKIVLSRAVNLHVERKTMVYNNKTVIFS
ncbi:formyltetrahydrofolate deformylase [Croceivirga thetidis]|uniref:Formyltetrahydrofolate deformylase n=1 Tax=Croceivirga thetidis TaxID=2721623 RepID=A0ABX1GSS4_9FLAO|nr:formyltetrahydrofolate deformylase [Croceivirga thetidis]NKI33005.1 formyltetrahydrofolate deformylase [Croceivirga thetidis]